MKIINEKDPTYSPLSLYFIIDNNLVSDRSKINSESLKALSLQSLTYLSTMSTFASGADQVYEGRA